MPSKLSFHINGFDNSILDLLQQMQPTTIKLFDYPSDANVDEIRRRCPQTLIVYRQFTKLSFNDLADNYVAELADTLNKLSGRGIVWEGLNEPILNSPADVSALGKWYIRFAQLMHARNELVAAFSFSTGNPRLDWVPMLGSAAAACDYIALHEYFSPTTGTNDLARYRQFRAQLPANAQKPILITECGLDDGSNQGWQKYKTTDEYMQILANYDAELLKDDYVIGAQIFQYGGGVPWQTFDVSTIGKRIADYISSGGPSPNPLQQAAITAAQKLTWMPINTDGALYKFALAKNLGYPQTDEFPFTVNNVDYIGQVYNLGIVYVKKGDWGNVKWVKKPDQ